MLWKRISYLIHRITYWALLQKNFNKIYYLASFNRHVWLFTNGDILYQELLDRLNQMMMLIQVDFLSITY